MLHTSFLHPRLAAAILDPAELLAFWRAAGPGLWFAGDPDFDRGFAGRFAPAYAAAREEGLPRWEQSPAGALTLTILLDQYPRSAFHGRPEMYATDAQARRVAGLAVAEGFDAMVDSALRIFFYLPFGHAESIDDQNRAVALCAALGEPHAGRAARHRDIVARFGRFPQRNAILKRPSTPRERAWLAAGG